MISPEIKSYNSKQSVFDKKICKIPAEAIDKNLKDTENKNIVHAVLFT